MTPEAKARQTIDALLVAAGFGNEQQTPHKWFVEKILLRLPPIAEQVRIVAEVDRHLCIVREVEVDTNLKRVQAMRQATLQQHFSQM